MTEERYQSYHISEHGKIALLLTYFSIWKKKLVI